MSTITYLWNKFFIPMPREIIVVRHAQSTRNLGLDGKVHFTTQKELDLYGPESDPEIDISRNGELQAKKAGKILASMGLIPNVVIHSGYRRTINTACHILSGFPKPSNIPFVENSNLRERRAGYTFQMIQERVDRHFPWIQEHWDKSGPYMAVPVGGESFIEMTEGRIRHALLDICQKYRGKRVLIVGHGGTNRCIHMALERMTICQADSFCRDKTKVPKNCSISQYHYDPEINRMVTVSYAEDLVGEYDDE